MIEGCLWLDFDDDDDGCGGGGPDPAGGALDLAPLDVWGGVPGGGSVFASTQAWCLASEEPFAFSSFSAA